VQERIITLSSIGSPEVSRLEFSLSCFLFSLIRGLLVPRQTETSLQSGHRDDEAPSIIYASTAYHYEPFHGTEELVL